MKTAIKLIMLITLSFAIFSCSGGPQLMPNVSGKAGEVVVVINKGMWEGESGSSLRSFLTQDQPFLPQREPMFDLVNIPHSAFTSIFQTHRNIIIVNTNSDLKESKIVFQENVWAAPQIVITVSAPDAKQANEIIAQQSSKIMNALEQAERNRNIANAKKYEERSLREVVASEFGGSPYYPKGYSIKSKAQDFIWISYEPTHTNQAIIIYKFPFKDSTDFEISNLIAMRNAIMQKYVPGPLEGTYMITSRMVEPKLLWVRYNKRVFAEMRGLWEVYNDFMGGPFVSHFFLDKERKNIIAVDGFVYAPKYPKRNYMRQVESIMYSFDFL